MSVQRSWKSSGSREKPLPSNDGSCLRLHLKLDTAVSWWNEHNMYLGLVTRKTNEFGRHTPETVIMGAGLRGISSVFLFLSVLQVFGVKASRYYFLLQFDSHTFSIFWWWTHFWFTQKAVFFEELTSLYKRHSLPSQVQVFHDFSRRSGCEQTDILGGPAQELQRNSS